MGFDDLCNTGLVLGLGFPSSSSSAGEIKASKKRQPPPAAAPGIISDQPSLTLSLSGETFAIKKAEHAEEINTIKGTFACSDHHSADLYRQDSAASSFSNVSVKREREIACSEDGEIIERNHHHHHHNNNSNIVSSRVSDEDDDGSNGRKKLRLSKAQSALLEESFKQHITLNPKQKQDLARELNLRPRQVEVWFQNRRARTKLKQTEVDCELLKKCCETLTDENRRLHVELQELKALKLAQPLYMQLPAATLTMCPSCERLGGGVVPENAAKSAYAMAPKSHFYSPFTNQSAAC